MKLDGLLVLMYSLYLMLCCCPSVCGQLQPGDIRLQAQTVVTNKQSNQNEASLQRQVDLHTIGVKLQLAGALPGGTEQIQVPIAGKSTDSLGRSVTISGTLTLTFETDTTPVPPPIGTTLTGVRSTETGLVVTSAPSGTRLLLEGTNLVKEGTLYTVTTGGEKATVLRGIDNLIEFRAPPVPAGKPKILVLYWLQSNAWIEKGRLPFEVAAAEPVPPNPEPIPPQGANPRFDTITQGDRLVVAGAGFGTVLGKLLLDKRPQTIVAWTEERIECLPTPMTDFRKIVVDLWRPAEGWYTAGWEPLP